MTFWENRKSEYGQGVNDLGTINFLSYNGKRMMYKSNAGSALMTAAIYFQMVQEKSLRTIKSRRQVYEH